MSSSRIDRIAFGKFVRKMRKSKKLRQEDLVDSNLSQPVLSNIERGEGHVSEEKMQYVLKKLGVEEDLSHFYQQETEEEADSFSEKVKIKLISIENTIDMVSPDQGLEELRELQLPPRHPCQVTVEYLKGKCYFHKKNWTKAHNHFFNAINLIDRQSPDMSPTNIKGACYHELSRIEYIQNNFKQALRYSNLAEQYFVPNGDRKYYLDMILTSRVIYLEKMNRFGDAQTVLDQITEKAKTQNHETDPFFSNSKESLLNMYEMQAKLLLKGNRFSQAIQFALKGIELARIDKMYDRSFELWTTLGSIYIEMGKLELAGYCFTAALKLDKKVKREYLLSYVYTQLGMLYYKQEDFQRSEKEFLEALKYSRKTNDVYHEIQALTGLSKCWMKLNKRDQAISHLQEALSLANQHFFVDQRKEILLILANYLREIGDPRFQNYALDFFYSHVETAVEGGEGIMAEHYKRHSAGDPPGG